MKLITPLLLCLIFFQNCSNNGSLTIIDKLPKKLKENSGIVQFNPETAWFVEDGGNSDNLYKINFKGNIIKHLDVKNHKNVDWEDLTKDKKGNIYIGDFGNNDSKRRNLRILKLPNPEKEKGDHINAKIIQFKYPEQHNYSPKKGELIYDAEAFFHNEDHLYIFTKNRAKPFTGETSIYQVPDKKGKYKAKYMGNIKLCADELTCKVTSADISPDGKTIVLLGYGKLWVITNFKIETLSKGNIKEIDLGVRTQLESVCFTNNNTLLLSDEARDDTGGNLYSYNLK